MQIQMIQHSKIKYIWINIFARDEAEREEMMQNVDV